VLRPLAAILEDVAVFDLHSFGLDYFFEAQLEPALAQGATVARVAAEHRETYEIWGQAGPSQARLAGRLRNSAPPVGLPAVGDWVVLRAPQTPDVTCVIERVLDRRTLFTRGAAGREAKVQVVAANVDLVFVVTALDRDFNLRRLERYVARIGASGAEPLLLLNKADLCEESAQRQAEVEARFPSLTVCSISALRGRGLEALTALLRPGLTVALVGSSGAGKSTLVNALAGQDLMLTGEAPRGMGNHITTHRQLVLLPGGGLLLDTPGMRELQLLDEEGLEAVFGDIAELAAQCRFPDCQHESEPGCAVNLAVQEGRLDPERLDHFRKLEREAKAYEVRQDEHRRRAADRAFGHRCNQIGSLKRRTRGEP
jgi:ribosome biogenesis GTPase